MKQEHEQQVAACSWWAQTKHSSSVTDLPLLFSSRTFLSIHMSESIATDRTSHSPVVVVVDVRKMIIFSQIQHEHKDGKTSFEFWSISMKVSPLVSSAMFTVSRIRFDTDMILLGCFYSHLIGVLVVVFAGLKQLLA